MTKDLTLRVAAWCIVALLATVAWFLKDFYAQTRLLADEVKMIRLEAASSGTELRTILKEHERRISTLEALTVPQPSARR